jgi:hypothetical protein
VQATKPFPAARRADKFVNLLTQPDVPVLLSTLSFYDGELHLPAQTLADRWLWVARDNVLVY